MAARLGPKEMREPKIDAVPLFPLMRSGFGQDKIKLNYRFADWGAHNKQNDLRRHGGK